MINYDKLDIFCKNYISDRDIPGRGDVWRQLLEITSSDVHQTDKEIIERAILSCCGNFNYWEVDGKIEWPENLNGQSWFDVIMDRRDINTMNLPKLRSDILGTTRVFLQQNFYSIHSIYSIRSPYWWADLSKAFGNDPLRKRETLLYIILSDLGFKDIYCPNVGCIDYNLIVALRYHGIIEGYAGNTFNISEETNLRTECLVVCQEILKRYPELNVSKLDNVLYTEGRCIRHTEPDWESHFCYRFGCYFY